MQLPSICSFPVSSANRIALLGVSCCFVSQFFVQTQIFKNALNQTCLGHFDRRHIVFIKKCLMFKPRKFSIGPSSLRRKYFFMLFINLLIVVASCAKMQQSSIYKHMMQSLRIKRQGSAIEEIKPSCLRPSSRCSYQFLAACLHP